MRSPAHLSPVYRCPLPVRRPPGPGPDLPNRHTQVGSRINLRNPGLTHHQHRILHSAQLYSTKTVKQWPHTYPVRLAAPAETGPIESLNKWCIRKFREKKSEPQNISQNVSHGYTWDAGFREQGERLVGKQVCESRVHKSNSLGT